MKPYANRRGKDEKQKAERVEGWGLVSDKPAPARDKSKLHARWSTLPLAGDGFPSLGDSVYAWGSSLDSVNTQSPDNSTAEDGVGRNQLNTKACCLGQ